MVNHVSKGFKNLVVAKKINPTIILRGASEGLEHRKSGIKNIHSETCKDGLRRTGKLEQIGNRLFSALKSQFTYAIMVTDRSNANAKHAVSTSQN